MHRSTHRACALGCNGVRTADSCRMQFGRTPGPSQAVAGAVLNVGKPIYLHPRLAHPLQGARAGTFWAHIGTNQGNPSESHRILFRRSQPVRSSDLGHAEGSIPPPPPSFFGSERPRMTTVFRCAAIAATGDITGGRYVRDLTELRVVKLTQLGSGSG